MKKRLSFCSPLLQHLTLLPLFLGLLLPWILPTPPANKLETQGSTTVTFNLAKKYANYSLNSANLHIEGPNGYKQDFKFEQNLVRTFKTTGKYTAVLQGARLLRITPDIHSPIFIPTPTATDTTRHGNLRNAPFPGRSNQVDGLSLFPSLYLDLEPSESTAGSFALPSAAFNCKGGRITVVLQ